MGKKGWISLCAGLLALLLLTLSLSYTHARRAHSAENALRALYESAVLSSLQELEKLQSHIDKALISPQEGASVRLLSAVSSGAAGVQQSLALLPLRQDGASGALKFANQLQDYAAALIGQAEKGVTDAQLDTLEKLSDACESMTNALRNARQAWEEADTGIGERSLMDEEVAYPTLIYDGPFSDAARDENPRLLAQLQEITREGALAAAQAFVGADRVQQLEKGTDVFGPIPCYGVTATADGIQLQLAVTKQGGKVLWMFPEHANFAQTLTIEQCREQALDFLKSRGFGAMQPLHFQVYDGLAVLNFAAVQDHVLLYPDQIKVQVRMDTGAIMGVECQSYITHHHERENIHPALTAEEALQHISEKLALTQDPVLCLIPKHGQEILCYEFTGLYDGSMYHVYLNANTAEQTEILKIVETANGLAAE